MNVIPHARSAVLRARPIGSVEPMIGTLGRAFDEAKRLGHQWVGPQHVLLAILNGDEGSMAVEALNGLTAPQFEEHFLGSLLRGSPPVRSEVRKGPHASPAPIFYKIDGWVMGYATASGLAPSDETVLLALCSILEHPLAPGHERADVAAAVCDTLGLPRIELSPDRVWLGEVIDVPIDRLDPIRAALVEAGLLVGFNLDHDNDRAWVIVSQDDERTRAVIAATTSDPSQP